MGKSVPYIVNSIRLLSLPDALKDGLLSGLISEGHARALVGIGDTRLIIEAYKQILKEKSSVRRAEEIARKCKKVLGKETEEKIDINGQVDKDELELFAQEIENFFNIPSLSVKVHQSKVMTRIEFRLRGDQEKGLNLIEKLKDKFNLSSNKQALK
jgi:ParB family chromosome partitioning protein